MYIHTLVYSHSVLMYYTYNMSCTFLYCMSALATPSCCSLQAEEGRPGHWTLEEIKDQEKVAEFLKNKLENNKDLKK